MSLRFRRATRVCAVIALLSPFATAHAQISDMLKSQIGGSGGGDSSAGGLGSLGSLGGMSGVSSGSLGNVTGKELLLAVALGLHRRCEGPARQRQRQRQATRYQRGRAQGRGHQAGLRQDPQSGEIHALTPRAGAYRPDLQMQMDSGPMRSEEHTSELQSQSR